MRWNEPQCYQVGDTRVRTFFAWFPVLIHNTRKNVWLEWVTVEEQYGWAGFSEPQLVWRAICEVR